MWLKNRYTRVLTGWASIFGVWFIIFLIINFIPSKLTVEKNSEYETRFYPLSEFNVDGSFIASSNYLNRVDVLFKNPNLESRDELEVLVKNGNTVVYKQSFTGFNFGDTSHARLDFTPIPDSTGKEYIVSILPTKIVDGKLKFGIKNNQINFIQYYSFRFSVQSSINTSLNLLRNIIFDQPVVAVLPLLLVLILLW